MRVKIVFVIAAFCLATPLLGERFRWAVEEGVSYRVNSYINEERFINGESYGIAEIRNKAVLHAVAVSNTNAAQYRGEFQYYEREGAGEDYSYYRNAEIDRRPFALKEIYPTEFWRDQLGKYYITPDMLMPVVRDVPLFIKDDVKPGAMWRSEGHELHDLKAYGLVRAYIPFTARYIYVGDKTVGGKRIATFSITYTFSHHIQIEYEKRAEEARRELARYRVGSAEYRRVQEEYEQKLSMLKLAPQRISGSCIQLYNWDVAARLPHSLSEDFHFIFTLENGEIHEFKGFSEATFEIIRSIRERDADAIVQRFQKSLGAGGGGAGGTGISVRHDERGIVFDLSDILFDTDSAQIKPEAHARLAALAKEINASGKFEVRVEGHTDNTGDAEYNMELSRRRAREVAGFLTGALETDPRNISWRGHGMTKPSASNDTAAGRAKNRRVEIILLTNE